MKRTNTCGDLRLKNVNEEVILQGWVKKVRKFGALTFVDLRDRYGYTQLIIDENHKDYLEDLKPESVWEVKGLVKERKTKNPQIQTGEIEVEVQNLTLINRAELVPFQIENEIETLWDTRLKYRYLDLRRPNIQQIFLLRSQINHLIRNYFVDQNFVEVETPFFGKSTPEGARDFLVPSRLNKNKFYALPQSPQLFKQLLMVAGFDRYFQIVRCFRDEDLRVDRELEFTQLDMEMSFAKPDDVMKMMEELLKLILKKGAHEEISQAFQRITYREAIEKYGSDKPDLRFELPIQTLTKILANSSNKLIQTFLTKQEEIRGLGINKLLNKAQLEAVNQIAQQFNLFGITYVKLNDNIWTGPLASSLTDLEKENLKEIFGLTNEGTIILSGAVYDKISQVMGSIRNALGKMFNLYTMKFKPLWVIDFPLFEFDEEENRYVAAHHPFTMPKEESLIDFDTNQKEALANAYDLVLNGFEIGGGSQRITKIEIQQRMFQAIQLSQEQIEQDFGWFIDAYRYGAPYHSGMALGLDRILMILTDVDNVRDVIAFPKNLNGIDPMSNAPSFVSEKQLNDLALKLVTKK